MHNAAATADDDACAATRVGRETRNGPVVAGQQREQRDDDDGQRDASSVPTVVVGDGASPGLSAPTFPTAAASRRHFAPRCETDRIRWRGLAAEALLPFGGVAARLNGAIEGSRVLLWWWEAVRGLSTMRCFFLSPSDRRGYNDGQSQ